MNRNDQHRGSRTGVLFCGAILILAGTTFAEMVDPLSPAEKPPVPARDWARWPRTRIQQLEAERNRLLEQISELPQHDPITLSTHLGYHSRYEEPASGNVPPDHHIVFRWPWYRTLDSVALVPASHPEDPGAYSFPRRFKIEVSDDNPNEFETVVNWMEEDFPDPGLYPVFFAGLNRRVRQVRITMPHTVREPDAAYFAFGEIFMLQQRLDGSTGANMAAWGPEHVEVEASGSLSVPPLWDLPYLHDGVTGLGYPLSDETADAPDLIIDFGEDVPPEPIQFTLDIGRPARIGRIDLWSAAAPHLLALPSFGFPGEVVLELSEDPGFQTSKVIKAGRPEANQLSVVAESYSARYIRVTMSELKEYQGKRILGLGEIWITEYERPLALNCRITAQGIPGEYMSQLPRLVDGHSRQRKILPQGEWVKGLARRRPLDQRLAEVDRELVRGRADWLRIKQRAGIWAGGIVVVGLAGGLAAQRKLRKRSLNKLKWRITRDLHDEVGSNLGGISLASEHLTNAEVDAEVKEELHDLSLMAREAWASLREVIWVTNESSVRLPSLIQKLVERAERVLSGMAVDVEIAQDCPDCAVPLPVKRQLIMLFKEVVHNCARHAKASRIWLDFSIVDQCLRMSVCDNGCGFDPEKQPEGLGLGSMRNRVEELRGKLELDSQPGEGTSVVLMVPLASLRINTEHFYKSSN